MNSRSGGWGAAGLLVIGGFWLLGVGIPVVALVSGLSSAEIPLLLDPVILSIARFTFFQALASSFLAAALGLPLGLLVGAHRSQGGMPGRWIEVVLSLSFGVPAVVAANAWVIWLGRSGWFAAAGLGSEWSYSLKAVLLAHVVFNVPWIAMLVAQARFRVSQRQLDAAIGMGAGGFTRFRWIIWPRIRHSFLGAWAQAQTFCAMSFVLVLILGGGPPVQTLETALYSRLRFGTLDLSGAIACGIWELVITLVPWMAVLFFEAREVEQGSPQDSVTFVRERGARAVNWRDWGLLSAASIWLVPYLAVLGPDVPGRFLNPAFLNDLRGPLSLSIALAVLTGACTVAMAAVGACTVGFCGRWRGVTTALTLMLTLPGGISVLSLGLGFWLAYGRWIDPFSGSFAAILVLQIVLFLPVAFRMLRPLLFDPRERLLEAAATLGAGPFTAFRWVEWPRWRPVLLTALAIIMAASLGEVAAVSLFYSEELVPLPLVLSRWMTQYRFEDARALSALLLFLSTGTITAVLMGGNGNQKRVPLA